MPDRLLHDSVASLLEAHWLVRDVYGQPPAGPPSTPDAANAALVIRTARGEVAGLLSRLSAVRAGRTAGSATAETILEEIEGRLRAITRLLQQS